MKRPIPHSKFLFALGAIFTLTIATETTSAGWVWKPAPPQMMGGMYQTPQMRSMYPAPTMGGMYRAPQMGGMYPAPRIGGMYQVPGMGAMQGFSMNNSQRMYPANNFRIIQETWTPPVD